MTRCKVNAEMQTANARLLSFIFVMQRRVALAEKAYRNRAQAGIWHRRSTSRERKLDLNDSVKIGPKRGRAET